MNKKFTHQIDASALLYYRKLRKFTQEVLSEKSGISQSLISKYENGCVESVEKETVEALASALCCSVNDLQTSASKRLEVARGVYLLQQVAKILENDGGLDISNATDVLKLFETAQKSESGELIEDRPPTEAEKDVMEKLQNGLI